MAKIYYKKIINREMTLDQVPERWREEVRKLLEEGDS